MTKCSDCPLLFDIVHVGARAVCCMDAAKHDAYQRAAAKLTAEEERPVAPIPNRKQRRAAAAAGRRSP